MEDTATATATPQRTCFVVMGFGTKTDYESGRVLDLDKSYRMIKPAVEAANLKCIRADEIMHSGVIDLPMYEQLLNADVVVADISTSNNNAFYELGIRHALRPFTTIIVSEDGIKAFPFDVNHVAVRKYHHMGAGIDYDEVLRFQALLTQAIREISEATAKDPNSRDSPVYTFLQNLMPPAIKKIQAAVAAAVADSAGAMDAPGAGPAAAMAAAPAEVAVKTHSMLMGEVDQAQKNSNWAEMKSLLEVIRRLQAQGREQARQGSTVALAPDADREDPYLLQRLALATYKSQLPTEAAALQAARDLLAPLNPATTNDTETLGLWGTIHKLRVQLAQRDPALAAPADTLRSDLDEAVRAYERGFHLRNNYYNGINYAFMLNARAAAATTPAEAIADYVQAQRVRREVITLCDQWLADYPPTPARTDATQPGAYQQAVERYWVLATKAEACAGLGDDAQADRIRQEIDATVPEKWMADTATEQLAKLQKLLEANPLRHIAA